MRLADFIGRTRPHPSGRTWEIMKGYNNEQRLGEKEREREKNKLDATIKRKLIIIQPSFHHPLPFAPPRGDTTTLFPFFYILSKFKF